MSDGKNKRTEIWPELVLCWKVFEMVVTCCAQAMCKHSELPLAENPIKSSISLTQFFGDDISHPFSVLATSRVNLMTACKTELKWKNKQTNKISC